MPVIALLAWGFLRETWFFLFSSRNCEFSFLVISDPIPPPLHPPPPLKVAFNVRNVQFGYVGLISQVNMIHRLLDTTCTSWKSYGIYVTSNWNNIFDFGHVCYTSFGHLYEIQPLLKLFICPLNVIQGQRPWCKLCVYKYIYWSYHALFIIYMHFLDTNITKGPHWNFLTLEIIFEVHVTQRH